MATVLVPRRGGELNINGGLAGRAAHGLKDAGGLHRAVSGEGSRHANLSTHVARRAGAGGQPGERDAR